MIVGLFPAPIVGVTLNDSISVSSSSLTNADFNLANLNEALFDCKSLRTTNFTVNTSQIHIVNSSLNEVSSCK